MKKKAQIRTQFNENVFKRDNFTCVMCSNPAVDAHHIISRDLFPDGGYNVNNGVSLCAECHILAEKGEITPETLREEAGIKVIYLP